MALVTFLTACKQECLLRAIRARLNPSQWRVSMLRNASLCLWLLLVALAPALPSAANDEEFALPRRDHLGQLGVTRWHRQGQRGAGVKVAVLDTGFRGWRQFLGRGLPDHVA